MHFILLIQLPIYEVFLICMALENGVHTLECYSCTNVTSLCECNSITTCTSGYDACYSEYITTSAGKLYTLGCKRTQACSTKQPSPSLPPPVGRALPQTCNECCNTSNCNREICQDPDPSCTDTAPFDCEVVGSTANYCADTDHAKKYCKRFCGFCRMRDGGWSTWSTWSSCDVTCGNGTKSRSRMCTNPAPRECGANCSGKSQDTEACYHDFCPVHGGWSLWSPWGSCSATCDIGMQRRDRDCSNPYPSRGGDACYGDSRDDRLCFMPGCRDGGWSDWGTWSQCSTTCDVGTRTRTRTCSNPRPSIAGLDCKGIPSHTDTCVVHKCKAKTAAFTASAPKSVNQTWIFTQIKLNEGDGYNTSTGIFTCHYPGMYFFSANLVTGDTAIQSCIVKNAETLDIIYIKSLYNDNNNNTLNATSASSGSVTTHLDAGDKVSVEHNEVDFNNTTHTYTIRSHSTFSGFLFQPDE